MSRKYRQRGYQDDDGRDQRPRPSPRQAPTSGPRGRGLGAPTGSVFRCAACGAAQELHAAPVGATCPACGQDLRSCVNCRHFDTAARWECRRQIPERMASKRKGNPCPEFAAKITAERAADAEAPSSGRSAFDALFKGI